MLLNLVKHEILGKQARNLDKVQKIPVNSSTTQELINLQFVTNVFNLFI